MLQSAAQQVLWPTSLALQLWRGGAASRQLAAAAVAGANRSTTSSGTHDDNLQGLSHHQQSLPQSSEQQQQQQPRTPGWLQQLTSCSRQERMAALSSLTISLQGKVAELAAAASSPELLSRAAMAAAVTATTAAAAPAGASLLASFQGSRYSGGNSLSRPGEYWLRQMGMQDNQVTALLVAANVLCFGMQQISTTFTSYCVRVGYKVAAGEYWRLLTAAFVHGNVLHVGINTLALWNMGRMIEPQLGAGPFLTVYLGSAITGNLLGYYMCAGFATSMGSSSALFGLLGAFLASSWVNRHSVYTSRAQVVSVLQTLGINMALMAFFGGHMDNWAHLGGFAGGAAIAAAVAPRYHR